MKLDRLLGILTVLLQRDRVTAPYLAEKFEVTRRTIGRDIDALCQAGIPIVTRQGGGGGISIAEGYRLDKSVLTVDELSGIIAAVKGIGSVRERSETERLLDKLATGRDAVVSLREPVVIDLASHYKGNLTAKIECLKKAIRERRMVSFDYYYEKGQTRRRIEPYLVVFHWAAWYAFGFCPDRDGFRLFKLTRLWRLSLLEETYSPREIPSEALDFDARLPDDKRLVALFDPSARYQLIDMYGLDCFTETEAGFLRFEVGYTNRAYMIAWILGFGEKARVVEPENMREEIVRTLKAMRGVYGMPRE